MQLEEEKEPELQPIIKQTRFFLPKNRSYLFDVNQEISIYKLKKMISVAANLGKNIRLFHDNVEYTDKDYFSLEELFPKLQLIEFKIELQQQQIEEIDDLISLHLKSFCGGHRGKYPNFYCHTCKKSICIECYRGNEHKDHDIKEKYDYLQESKELIENVFLDLKKLLGKGDRIPGELIQNIKTKITVEFFPKLVEIVKKIEQNMIDLITFFLEKDESNYNLVQNNLTSLKTSCVEGLDKLKENIDIEDLMVDENIFLTFDKKYRSISCEKEKIVSDINTYKLFKDNLNLVQDIVNKTYNEIYEFLTKYLEITKFTEVRNKLIMNITEINKKEILEKILGDIKQKEEKPKFVEFLKHIRKLNDSKKSKEKEKSEDVEMKDATSTAEKTIKKEKIEEKENKEKEKEKEKEKDKTDNNNNKEQQKPKETEKEIKDKDKEKEKPGKNKEKEIKKKEGKEIGQNTSDKKQQSDTKNSQNGRRLKSNSLKAEKNNNKEKQNCDDEEEAPPGRSVLATVMSILPGKNQLLIYNSKKRTNSLKEDITFHNLLGIKQFLKESSWVNYNNKLYILGGIDSKSKKKVKTFIEYDGIKDTFKRLPESKHPHVNHSLIVHEDSIYCIGGKALDECEKFDLNSNLWSIMPKMAFIQENPVLYIHNNILYSMFGKDEKGKYIDNIQKLNLKNGKSKWTNVTYDRNGCNLKMVGCGVITMETDKIYLLGGKLETEVSKAMIEFDFKSMKANKNDNMLGQKAYFKESMMLRIGDEQYGNYSIDPDNSSSLITVTIDKRNDKNDK